MIRWRRWAAVVSVLVLIGLPVGGVFVLARNDVMSYVADEPGVRVVFAGAAPSRHHIVWLFFRIEGHSELSKAYWRLRPWRQVVVEK